MPSVPMLDNTQAPPALFGEGTVSISPDFIG